MNITTLSKRTFSKIRIPSIKFLGNRNKLFFKKEEREETQEKQVKKMKTIGFSSSKPNPTSYFDFLENFNQINSDFDIFRQGVTEEDLKNVNYIEYNVEDWKKIKFNGDMIR